MVLGIYTSQLNTKLQAILAFKDQQHFDRNKMDTTKSFALGLPTFDLQV
jgi:hypothetical protein